MLTKKLRKEIIEKGTYEGKTARILKNTHPLKTIAILRKDGVKKVFKDVLKVTLNEKTCVIYYGYIVVEYDNIGSFWDGEEHIYQLHNYDAVLRLIKIKDIDSIRFIDEYTGYKCIDDSMISESKDGFEKVERFD